MRFPRHGRQLKQWTQFSHPECLSFPVPDPTNEHCEARSFFFPTPAANNGHTVKTPINFKGVLLLVKLFYRFINLQLPEIHFPPPQPLDQLSYVIYWMNVVPDRNQFVIVLESAIRAFGQRNGMIIGDHNLSGPL